MLQRYKRFNEKNVINVGKRVPLVTLRYFLLFSLPSFQKQDVIIAKIRLLFLLER